MPTPPPLPRFLDALVEWAGAWRPAAHRVTVTRGPIDRPKTAAWLMAVGSATAGEVIVWDTGECEVEVYDAVTLTPLWLEHFDVESDQALVAFLERFALSLSGDNSGH